MPGAKYRLQATRFGGAGDRFSYDLVTKYVAIVDAFEPNNTKDDAKPITVGATIMASPAASSAKANLEDADQADFYKVTLAAGTATVAMTNVPDGYTCDLTVFDPSGAKVNEAYVTTPGADCILDTSMLTDLTGGDYIVEVTAFSGTSRGGPDATVPAFVTGHYSLEVTQ